ncbi:MAG: cation transporter dimerization domain-containing protein [Kiritimatiellia bacterium]|nr:cation transporter dimerization domain-containing protein [Kiritimatiellia bacterium]
MIATLDSQIRGFHNLRTRNSGWRRFIEFHILVHPTMSVNRSHKLTDELTVKIREIMPNSLVTIHVEPCKSNAIRNAERAAWWIFIGARKRRP